MSSTRSRLLDATRRLVADRGAAVTMADVAKAAGVSRQAVYLHFHSRADLFMSVVRYMDDQDGIRARCEEALRTPEPITALRTFTIAWLRYAARIQPIASALMASRQDDPDASAAWNDRMRELRGGFLTATRRLATADRLRPGLSAQTAADLAWAMTSVPVWVQLTVDCDRPAGEAERHLADAVVGALTNG